MRKTYPDFVLQNCDSFHLYAGRDRFDNAEARVLNGKGGFVETFSRIPKCLGSQRHMKRNFWKGLTMSWLIQPRTPDMTGDAQTQCADEPLPTVPRPAEARHA